MSDTWYRTEKYSDDVEPVEVIKETKCTVQLSRSTRRAKCSEYERYFTDEKEAWRYLLERSEGKERILVSKLKDTREAIAKCKKALRNLGDVIIE